jgi:metallophosphoesterase superfamily enzyme
MHDPADNVSGDNYCFSGHVHPAVQVKGKGKQTLRFPCFYFGRQQAILPAFSRFTGTYLIEPGKEEKAFAIVERELVEMGY